MTVTPLAGIAADLAAGIEVSASLREAVYRGKVISESNPVQLAAALALAIYGHAHAGLIHERTTRPSLWRDPELEQRAAKSMPVGRLRARGDLIQDRDGALTVDVGGVRVSVPSDSPTLESRNGAEVILSLPTHWTRRSPGFFSAGSPSRAYKAIGPILRVYVRCESAERALGTWRALGQLLPELEIPWWAKVLSSSHSYPRSDAIVVYLNRLGWAEAGRIVRFIEERNLADSGGSMLARRWSDGIGLAFEPIDVRPTYTGLSFGQHRSRVIAEGVVRAARDGVDVETAVDESLRNALVDPSAPWRNITSPTIFEVE